MRQIAVLGSTGSVGRNALDVIKHFSGKFKVVALSTNSNIEVLSRQIKEFHPEFACVRDESAACALKSRGGLGKTKLLTGEDGLRHVVQDKHTEKILLAISGSGALSPLLAAIDSGKDIAMANKEALVMAGPIIMRKSNAKKVKIIPVDSEESAIWQCLEGENLKTLKTIYLTASGGPLRLVPRSKFKSLSVKKVLKHPKWRMGRKITVDSATLMNKGLEVLETIFLFNVAAQNVKVLIHPEAIIHSMVEFVDGAVLAQLSVTDMRIPIQYALSYPQRLPTKLTGIDFYKLGGLHFQKPDFRKFPCLELSYRAASEMGTAPCVLNAADEVSVCEFLKGRLKFIYIAKVIEKALSKHHNIKNPDLEDILEADAWARLEAHKAIAGLN